MTLEICDTCGKRFEDTENELCKDCRKKYQYNKKDKGWYNIKTGEKSLHFR